MERVDDTVLIGHLVKSGRKPIYKNELLRRSESTLMKLFDEVQTFCSEEKSMLELRSSMNTLFRPILLDGITMLELLGQTALGDKLRLVQTQYMGALKESKSLRLEQYLDLNLLREAIREYAALIHEQITDGLPIC